MNDRVADLRREALKCLELARIAISPIVRQEMLAMASRLHEISNSTPADFEVILRAFNDAKMADPPSQVAQQQQQQVQPKKEEGQGPPG
jgi:hypothetical protein